MQKIDGSSLSLKNLRLLVEVFESGSVSEGADRIGITQSSASHALDRLRDQLGDPLFVRMGRTVAPTDFLRATIPALKRALVELEAALSGGELTIGPGARPITIASNTTETLPALRRIRRRIREESESTHIRFIDIGGVSMFCRRLIPAGRI